MKLRPVFMRLLPMVALLLSTNAFAASKGSFSLAKTATINGYQLAAGDYQAKWEGAEPAIQVSILSHGKLVTTIPARLVELSGPASNDAVALRQNDDGSRSLVEIDFAGKKYELHFQADPAPAESPSQTDSN